MSEMTDDELAADDRVEASYAVPDALRALSEAATPGEWTREEEWRVTATGGAFYIPSAGPNRRRWMTSVASDSPHADAALIVAAVNDLRARLEGADTEYHEHVAGDKHSHAFNGPHSHGGVSALRFPRADTGGGIDVERLDAALGSLDESNITYEHGYSASGEPRDPDLFVEYEALRRAVARLRRG